MPNEVLATIIFSTTEAGEVNVTPDTIKKHAGGRPSRWSIGTAKKICGWVKRGLPLRYAGPLAGIPWSTCKEWVGKFPEFAPMLEEAHSEWVQSHVGNIERLSKTSEKASEWLLERRAKEEFSAPYTQSNTSQPSLNVLALGNDALSKLMQGWGGMIGVNPQPSQVVDITPEPLQIPDKESEPLQIADHIAISSNPQRTEEALPITEEKAPAENVQVVKRQRGRPRKYPKPDPTATPPPYPTPNL